MLSFLLEQSYLWYVCSSFLVILILGVVRDDPSMITKRIIISPNAVSLNMNYGLR